MRKVEDESRGRSRDGSLSQLEEGAKEWWRDKKRIREKRGALATWRKW